MNVPLSSEDHLICSVCRQAVDAGGGSRIGQRSSPATTGGSDNQQHQFLFLCFGLASFAAGVGFATAAGLMQWDFTKYRRLERRLSALEEQAATTRYQPLHDEATISVSEYSSYGVPKSSSLKPNHEDKGDSLVDGTKQEYKVSDIQRLSLVAGEGKKETSGSPTGRSFHSPMIPVVTTTHDSKTAERTNSPGVAVPLTGNASMGDGGNSSSVSFRKPSAFLQRSQTENSMRGMGMNSITEVPQPHIPTSPPQHSTPAHSRSFQRHSLTQSPSSVALKEAVPAPSAAALSISSDPLVPPPISTTTTTTTTATTTDSSLPMPSAGTSAPSAGMSRQGTSISASGPSRDLGYRLKSKTGWSLLSRSNSSGLPAGDHQQGEGISGKGDKERGTSSSTPGSRAEISDDGTNDVQVLASLLSQAPLFEKAPAAFLETIAPGMVREFFEAGEVVLEEGDYGNCMYFLVKGHVVGQRRGKTFEFQDGDFFGENEILTGGVRSATVVAKQDSFILSLGRHAVLTALSQFPSVQHDIERIILYRFESEKYPAEERLKPMVKNRIKRAVEKQFSQWKKILSEKISFQVGAKIGSGAAGAVYSCINSKTGQPLAVKVIKISMNGTDSANKAHELSVEQESTMMQELRHPNIVQGYGLQRDPKDPEIIYILMELAPLGAIQKVLKQVGGITELAARSYIRQALLGLKYLHDNGVIHRDIKPSNMLLGSDGTVKLADFGISTVVGGGRTSSNSINEGFAAEEISCDEEQPFHALSTKKPTVASQRTVNLCGTPAYMSPDAINGRYSVASDIWAMGCSLLEMITGKPPWSYHGFETSIQMLFHIATCQRSPALPRAHGTAKRVIQTSAHHQHEFDNDDDSGGVALSFATAMKGTERERKIATEYQEEEITATMLSRSRVVSKQEIPSPPHSQASLPEDQS